jgi:hypothetical protein
LLKGWDLAKLIGLGEITEGTILNVYVNNNATQKLIYINVGLRYLNSSKHFPRQIHENSEVGSSTLTTKEFDFEIV